MDKPVRLLLCAAALIACSKEPEPQRPYYRGDAAYDSPVSPAPATQAAPPATDPSLLAKLEPLAAFAGSDCASGGLSFTAADFVETYERWRKEFGEARRPHDAKIAGLPEPEIVDFIPGEREKGARARWSDAAGVQYGDALPRDGSAVTDAWTRVYGFRDLSVGDTIITQNGVPAEKWRRILWQPDKKRWSHFTEDQERTILYAEINGPLSKPQPDAKNSARFECERLQRGLVKFAGDERTLAAIRGNMKAAVVRSYEPELKLLAARSLVE